MQANLFKLSILQGVLTKAPEHRSELHRIPAIREVQDTSFSAALKEVTRREEQVLSVLHLPGIETVRRASLFPDKAQRKGKFEFSFEQWLKYEQICREWAIWAIGEQGRLIKTPPDSLPGQSWIEYLALWAFNASQPWLKKMILAAMPSEFGGAVVTSIMTDPDQLYLKGMIETATERIKTQFAKNHIEQVYAWLVQSAEAGRYPIDVARELHKMIGEGKLWYWLRIARTEAGLASNRAFDAMCDANGILYEEWSAASNACPICAGYNGQVWQRGQGPVPIEDSHPNCGCARVPLYVPGKEVQPRFERIAA